LLVRWLLRWLVPCWRPHGQTLVGYLVGSGIPRSTLLNTRRHQDGGIVMGVKPRNAEKTLKLL
jgi:hypothetical protein